MYVAINQASSASFSDVFMYQISITMLNTIGVLANATILNGDQDNFSSREYIPSSGLYVLEFNCK